MSKLEGCALRDSVLGCYCLNEIIREALTCFHHLFVAQLAIVMVDGHYSIKPQCDTSGTLRWSRQGGGFGPGQPRLAYSHKHLSILDGRLSASILISVSVIHLSSTSNLLFTLITRQETLHKINERECSCSNQIYRSPRNHTNPPFSIRKT